MSESPPTPPSASSLNASAVELASVSPSAPPRPVRALRAALQSAALLLGLVLLLIVTFIALRIPPLKALESLWTGAFGSAKEGHLYPISQTLVETAPLLLTSLGVVVAWRAGLFSIGGQGQLWIGALTATAIARIGAFLPAPLLTVAMLLGGIAGGAFWGALAGWLRVKRNVAEVISTIMLNYTAQYLVTWLVLGALREKGNHLSESESLPNAVLFPRLIPPAWSGGIQTSLHTGVVIALLTVPLLYLLLFRTTLGFELRVLGQNPEAARTARYPTDRLRLIAMLVSGGLAGLAGVIELLGSATGSLPAENFAGKAGFTAIPVALLGGLHPAGTLLSALFFGGLATGSRNLEQNTGVSSVLLYVIQAVAVLAVVGVRAWHSRKSGSETD